MLKISIPLSVYKPQKLFSQLYHCVTLNKLRKNVLKIEGWRPITEPLEL